MKDPIAIGLFGFAVPLIILACMFEGWLPMTGLGLELVIAAAFGGAAMYASGFLTFQIGNSYVSTVFFVYGSFFLALAWAGMNGSLTGAMKDAPQVLSVWYYLMAMISAVFLIGAFRLNLFLVVLFAALTAAFILLGMGNAQLAGTLFLVAAGAGVYLAAVHVIHPVMGPVLPVISLAKKAA